MQAVCPTCGVVGFVGKLPQLLGFASHCALRLEMSKAWTKYLRYLMTRIQACTIFNEAK